MYEDNNIQKVKTIIKQNIECPTKMSRLLGETLTPHLSERKKNAEISTPFWLKQEMLDKIPSEFWKTPKKVFEPCCGKGGFILDIVGKFMIGLEDMIPDKKRRYKTIVEKCLYFSDINKKNIYICKNILDPNDIYTLNYNISDTLKLNIKKKWDIDYFDAIIGNPPYEYSTDKARSSIWNKFVLKALEQIALKGYICMVHPGGWRASSGLYKNIKEKFNKMWMIYLEIHSVREGVKTFGAKTRYDWYVIQNIENTKKTTVKFEDGVILVLNIKTSDFIPNSQYKLLQKLYAKKGEKTCEILFSSFYAKNKKHMNQVKKGIYKYPCVHYINSINIPKFLYSSIKQEFFGVQKLIWTRSPLKFAKTLLDINGVYGLTESGYGITDTEENLKMIKKVFDSHQFRKFLESITIVQDRVNHHVLRKLRKDFWKEFL